MKKLVVLIALALCACTDPQAAYNAVDNLGLTDIKIGGHDAWACGDDYTYATQFTAKNAKGKDVAGVVCSGYMSGASVRFY